MRRGYVLVFGLLLLAGCRLFGPDSREPPKLKVPLQPDVVERGRYLVEVVTACWGCHTEGQKDVFSLPPKPDRVLGTGGDCFAEPHFPGTICGPNITNHADGIADWSDGELHRAIREGVNREGDTLFPMMPYVHYRHMSDEDTEAVIAYLRTATAAPGKVRPTDINWPVSMFINFAPEPVPHRVDTPNPKDTVAYGAYLVTIAGCKQCHTPVNGRKQLVEEELFSGGQVFKDDRTAHVVSSNLTPHETGLLQHSKEQFVGRFMAFRDPQSLSKVTAKNQTVMPWWAYAHMTKADLEAIYDYLMSLPPIEREVIAFPNL